MGLAGCKIIRHRGYFVIFRGCGDGDPDAPTGVAQQLFQMIPKDREKHAEWITGLRKDMDRIIKTYRGQVKTVLNGEEEVVIDGQKVAVSDCYESYDGYGYNYTVDLDHMLFHYHQHPVYHLDNMPPLKYLSQSFKESRDISQCGFFDCGSFQNKTPRKYRFNITHLGAPVIENKQFKLYDRHFSGTFAEPQDVLSLREGFKMSRAQVVSLLLLGIYADNYMQHRMYMLFEDIAFASDHKHIGWNGREIACFLAAAALIPLHILGPSCSLRRCGWPKIFEGAKNEFWYMRRHICFSLATHLYDDRNVRYHISRVIESILSTPDTSEIVFGVVFSLFHCVVIRVDKAFGGSFTRTEVLGFLPQPQHPEIKKSIDNWLTPGMKLLTLLGHLRANDDVEFFYRNLSTKWWVKGYFSGSRYDDERFNLRAKPAPKMTSNSSNSFRSPRVPNEILSLIANEIDSGDTLYNFALASKAAMAAAIPRLRFPQLRGQTLRSCSEWMHGHILESYEGDEVPKSYTSSSLVPVFNITFRGEHALLGIACGRGLDWYPDARHSYDFWDLGGYTLPRASLDICDTSGDTNENYKRFSHPMPFELPTTQARENYWKRRRRYKDGPHVGLQYFTKWTSEVAKMIHDAREGKDEPAESK